MDNGHRDGTAHVTYTNSSVVHLLDVIETHFAIFTTEMLACL